MSDKKFQQDPDGEVGLPKDIIDHAVQEAHPPHNHREEVQAELYQPVEMVLAQENAFKIKDGREEDLIELLRKVDSGNRNINRNPEIYRKAMIWARQIQIAEDKDPKASPMSKEQAIESAYNDLFDKHDVLRIRTQVKAFLKEFWDHDTTAVDSFLDKKIEAINSEPSSISLAKRIYSDGIDHAGSRWDL